MSPDWRRDNNRWKLRCGVAQGVVSDILPIGSKKFMWRVDVNEAFGMSTPCSTAEEGKERCEEFIRELLKDMAEGLGASGYEPPVVLTLRRDRLFSIDIKSLDVRAELERSLPRCVAMLGDMISMLVREYGLADDSQLTLDGQELKRKVLRFVEIRDERVKIKRRSRS